MAQDIAARHGTVDAIVGLVRYGRATLEPTKSELKHGPRKCALYHAAKHGHLDVVKCTPPVWPDHQCGSTTGVEAVRNHIPCFMG